MFSIDMKILPVNTVYNNKNTFKSSFRVYYPDNYKKYDFFNTNLIRTSTNIFREDLEWDKLVKFMKHHFADKEKVNSYVLACSDGSEAFTYAISLMEGLPPEVQKKYFPIKASDIDEEILKIAKEGRINIYPIEFLLAENVSEVDLSKYMTDKSVSKLIKGDEVSETDEISSYKVKQELLNSIEFKNSDILTELKNLKDEGNSVILCRNVFPYLKPSYVDKVILTAQEMLKVGSLFIIGHYDEYAKIEEKLLNNGFFKPIINCQNIFMRGDVTNLYKRLLSGRLV